MIKVIYMTFSGYFWMGKRVEDLTREELIEAIILQAEHFQRMKESADLVYKLPERVK